jgi:hypothetical protein
MNQNEIALKIYEKFALEIKRAYQIINEGNAHTLDELAQAVYAAQQYLSAYFIFAVLEKNGMTAQMSAEAWEKLGGKQE